MKPVVAIHPTAIIDPKAEIDAGVEIGPFCVIDGNVRVAGGCRLYQGVYLAGWTTVEENCVLHPGVIVGHEPQDTHFKGERSFCRIGRGTILREYVTVHRGTIPESETVIGEECFLLGGSHVAHNCALGNRVTLINDVLLAGHVEIGNDATLGGKAAVHQFARIGELAMVAGNARVVMDVPPFALTDTAGKVAGLNRVGMKRSGMSREDLHAIRQAYRTIYATGQSQTDAAALIAETNDGSSAVARLVAFLRAESRRGLAGRSKRRFGGSQAIDRTEH